VNAKPKPVKKKSPMPAPETAPQANDNLTLKWTQDPEWAAAFIPTLTQLLYTSTKPFEEFKRDSDAFLSVVQQVFNISFPHIVYSLQSTDALVGEVQFLIFIIYGTTC
jgi:hypothetical protein